MEFDVGNGTIPNVLMKAKLNLEWESALESDWRYEMETNYSSDSWQGKGKHVSARPTRRLIEWNIFDKIRIADFDSN